MPKNSNKTGIIWLAGIALLTLLVGGAFALKFSFDRKSHADVFTEEGLPKGWSFYYRAGWKVPSPQPLEKLKPDADAYAATSKGLTIMVSRVPYAGPADVGSYQSVYAENRLEDIAASQHAELSGVRSEE